MCLRDDYLVEIYYEMKNVLGRRLFREMKIEIMNRKTLEERAKQPFPSHTAIISCTDFEDVQVRCEYLPEHILRLEFDDVSLADFADFDGTMPPEDELERLCKKHHMFTSEQAAEVAEFYISIKDTTELLICQCEHGESRSAAIAAAIMQYISRNAIEIFADEKYIPNKTVYRMVLDSLNHIQNREGVIKWI